MKPVAESSQACGADKGFDAYCDDLRERLFPTKDRSGPVGEVSVDAQFLREMMAKWGSAGIWKRAYLDALRPFALVYNSLLKEAAEAESVGHEYPMGDYATTEVMLLHLRRAFVFVVAYEKNKPATQRTLFP